MKRLLSVAFLFCLSSTVYAASVVNNDGKSGSLLNCTSVDKPKIAALFERWNNSLRSGDAVKVAANYAHDAVLLPTMSNRVRKTDNERIDYFEHFLEKRPVGHIESRTIRVGCNDAIDNGVYSFRFADGHKVLARYTFTYIWNGKQWLISSHHSSAMPEKVG